MDDKLNQLFEKYLSNKCSDEEIITLLEYFKQEEQAPILRELITLELQRPDAPPIKISHVEDHLEMAYVNVKQQIGFGNRPAVRKITLWPRIAAAVVLAIVFGAGLFYFNLKTGGRMSDPLAYKNDVAPGRQGAVLTLANGARISLNNADNGVLADQPGVIVRKTSDGQLSYEVKAGAGGTRTASALNTLSTEKGQTYMLTLPDKSKVWLNAASSLTYATNMMTDSKRRITLVGEAYFEVAKDKAHPFVVAARAQEIEVLGTHFNVNSYADEPVIATTLLEGAVRITDGGSKQLLRPGEQGLNNGKGIKVRPADLENVTDWKDGEFNLERINFRTGMRKIARWYDVEVIYNASVPDDIEFGGWVSRNEKLSAVLRAIEAAGIVRFKIDGRKIYVSK